MWAANVRRRCAGGSVAEGLTVFGFGRVGFKALKVMSQPININSNDFPFARCLLLANHWVGSRQF